MPDINDRAYRDHQQGLVEAVDHQGQLRVAEEPVGAGIQRDEQPDVAPALREERLQDSPFLHLRVRATVEQTVRKAGKGGRGATKSFSEQGRKILPRDAHYLYLYPQGNQGEDQA